MKNFCVIIGLTVMIAALIGCATPSERAQKLFKTGEYEQLLERYPNEPIAQEARVKLAAQLLDKGEYQRILDEFADTPSAYHARERIAALLLDEQEYQKILTDYPDTPAAMTAREAVAQQLYDDGKLDELVAKYPNSQIGREARQMMGERAYEDAMSHKQNQDKIKALEAILINPVYAGTPIHEAVQLTLARLHGAKD